MHAVHGAPFALSSDAIRVGFTRHAGFLEAVVSGFKSPAGVARVLEELGAQARAAGLPALLIDVTQVVGQMNGSDHAAVGNALAAQLGPMRCAVVARADRPRGEIAPAARAGGLDYRAFDDRASALRWLAGPVH